MDRGRGNAIRALLTVTLVGLCLAGVGTGSALADAPVGTDPSSNFPTGQLPLACRSAPDSTACVNGAVYWLDQGPYKLPKTFPTLSPDKQAFILVNLDRIQYGLAPITGLTRELDGYALAGVKQDRDPESGDPNFNFGGDWAGAYTNMVVAYEEWMYDDGLGSTNLDCTQSNQSGCWGHRNNVLTDFNDETGPYAMGAAAGRDNSGKLGYALLLGRGTASYDPTYYYTWQQAVAAGATTNNYVVKAPPPLQVEVKTQANEVRIYISARSHAKVECQLSQWYDHRWDPYGWYSCGPTGTTYTQVSAGRYRVQVTGAGRSVTQYVTVQ